jgi:hypothetical protein
MNGFANVSTLLCDKHCVLKDVRYDIRKLTGASFNPKNEQEDRTGHYRKRLTKVFKEVTSKRMQTALKLVSVRKKAKGASTRRTACKCLCDAVGKLHHW